MTHTHFRLVNYDHLPRNDGKCLWNDVFVWFMNVWEIWADGMWCDIQIYIYIYVCAYVEESSYGRLIYDVFGEAAMAAMRRNSTKLLWFQHNSLSMSMALGRPVPGTHQGVEKLTWKISNMLSVFGHQVWLFMFFVFLILVELSSHMFYDFVYRTVRNRCFPSESMTPAMT